MGRNVRIDVRGAEERILTVSGRTGGCLISVRDDDGRLRIEVYRADETVDVITPPGMARARKRDVLDQLMMDGGMPRSDFPPVRDGREPRRRDVD